VSEPQTDLMEPWRQVIARYDKNINDSERFVCAAADIVRLENKVATLKRDLEKIRDESKWSGRNCRHYAGAALDWLRRM